MQCKLEYGPSMQFALFNFLFCMMSKDKLYGAKMQLFCWGEQTEQVIFKWFPQVIITLGDNVCHYSYINHHNTAR